MVQRSGCLCWAHSGCLRVPTLGLETFLCTVSEAVPEGDRWRVECWCCCKHNESTPCASCGNVLSGFVECTACGAWMHQSHVPAANAEERRARVGSEVLLCKTCRKGVAALPRAVAPAVLPESALAFRRDVNRAFAVRRRGVDAMLDRATGRPWAVRGAWGILAVAREAAPAATSKRLTRAELQKIIDDERAKRLCAGRAEEAATKTKNGRLRCADTGKQLDGACS